MTPSLLPVTHTLARLLLWSSSFIKEETEAQNLSASETQSHMASGLDLRQATLLPTAYCPFMGVEQVTTVLPSSSPGARSWHRCC